MVMLTPESVTVLSSRTFWDDGQLLSRTVHFSSDQPSESAGTCNIACSNEELNIHCYLFLIEN